MRHSFASLLSASGVALEDIARLIGHSGAAVTEAVYRKQIRTGDGAGRYGYEPDLPRGKLNR